jgi:hypothetical protein
LTSNRSDGVLGWNGHVSLAKCGLHSTEHIGRISITIELQEPIRD